MRIGSVAVLAIAVAVLAAGAPAQTPALAQDQAPVVADAVVKAPGPKFSAAYAAYGDGRYEEAVRLFTALAEAGYAPAQYNLGLLYMNGKGTARDDAAGLGWLRTSADQGYAPAENAVGTVYGKGQGVAQDHAAEASWYRKAADHGLAEAQFRLASMYSHGVGVARNDTEAMDLYRKAAD